jgi:hypothetical protein
MNKIIIVGLVLLVVLIYQFGKDWFLNRDKKPTELQIWFANNNLLVGDGLELKTKEMFDLLNRTYNSHLVDNVTLEKSRRILKGFEPEFINTVKGLRESITNDDDKLVDNVLSKFQQHILDTFDTYKDDKDQVITTFVIPLEMIAKLTIDSKSLGYDKINKKTDDITKQINNEINKRLGP